MYCFFQIKKTLSTKTQRLILQLIDISPKIFYDDMKAQEEYMNITTSTISHEMRNPLNSIIAQSEIMLGIVDAVRDFIRSIKNVISSDALKRIKTIKTNIRESAEVMSSSAQILTFNVEDVLGMAHIRARKFKKVAQIFSLNQCIQDIMKLQRLKAD